VPVERCTSNGQPGFRWGSQGRCYTGEGARARAERQGRAVEANKRRPTYGRVAEAVLVFLCGAAIAAASIGAALTLADARILTSCERDGFGINSQTAEVFTKTLCGGGGAVLLEPKGTTAPHELGPGV